MPTNFGALATNLPLPNGKIQIKRGAVDGSGTVSNANSGQAIIDGAGGTMQISYTPTYTCLWVIRTNIMSHGVADGAGWRRWDHYIRLTPADADGISLGYACPHQNYDNSTVEWDTATATASFRLSAGVAYTAYMTTDYVSAGSIRYHTGGTWLRMIGRIVGEGST